MGLSALILMLYVLHTIFLLLLYSTCKNINLHCHIAWENELDMVRLYQ